MKTAILIPARYDSKRLPGKALLRETGKYLVQHVYERACRSLKASAVIVATDDERIAIAVRSFGGRVAMTRRSHPSGTDRVAEVAADLDAEIIVNLQGDEPLLDPDHLDYVSDLLHRYEYADVATLATPLTSPEQYHNPNCVKVVMGDEGQAIYFSRAPVPCVRDGQPDFSGQPFQFFQHVGLYAYRRDFLLQLAAMPPSPLEHLEKLEQLRALAAGRRIQVGVVRHHSIGVDTIEDYRRFVAAWRGANGRIAA